MDKRIIGLSLFSGGIAFLCTAIYSGAKNVQIQQEKDNTIPEMVQKAEEDFYGNILTYEEYEQKMEDIAKIETEYDKESNLYLALSIMGLLGCGIDFGLAAYHFFSFYDAGDNKNDDKKELENSDEMSQ